MATYSSMLLKSIIVFLLCASCESAQTSSKHVLNANPVNVASGMRVEYWPVDTAVSVADTVVKQVDVFRLRWTTTSLNDNAVLDTVQDAAGKLVVAAHNRKTELQVWRNGQPLCTTILTKQLFTKTPHLASYSWHNMRYKGYRNEEFIFRAWISVPDSDVGELAEIGINKSGTPRLLKMLNNQ